MSVRKSERSESKLEVLKLSSEIALYTLKVCSNEKIFPKSQRWLLTKRIVDASLEAYSNIRRANKLRNDDSMQSQKRRELQILARAEYDNLLGLIDLAYNRFNLDGKRVYYWSGLIDRELKLLSGWIRSDKK